MPDNDDGFLDDLFSVLFYHAGRRWTKSVEGQIDLLYNRINDLEVALTSAQSDIDALNAVYTELDQATNDIASKLQSLIDHADTGNVSAADVVSHLTPLVQRLQSMGQSGAVESNTDPTTTTDPTNSPNPDSPLVNPAPDAPTDEPTPDPTVNPTGSAVPDDGSVSSDPGNSQSTSDGGVVSDPNSF